MGLLSISGFEAAFKCEPWPTTAIWGCADDGQDWRLLTNSASQEACMSRCEAADAEGADSACCFYSRSLGCNIKVGANRSKMPVIAPLPLSASCIDPCSLKSLTGPPPVSAFFSSFSAGTCFFSSTSLLEEDELS